MYKLTEECLFQKDYRIEENESIFDYVSSPKSDELDPEDTIAVISIQGTPYELNLPAAMIMDELLRSTGMEKIIEKFIMLFDIDQITAKTTIQDCMDELIALKAIKKG